jgi:putative aminopeptidase FrvX
MLSEKSLNFLEQLLNCSGPSGFELETAAVYRKYLSQFAHKVSTDVTGNTIGVLNEKADFKVMLAGHYDEIGFQVVHISDEGLLYFRNVGGIDKITVPGTEVEILTEKGRIHGVIGKKPIHLVEEKDRNQAMELKNLWIDIGAENKKETEKIVNIGDPVAVKTNFARLGKNRVMSKGMDDKIGAFVVAETLRELSLRKVNIAIYGVGTVQEELGLRGATTSAFGIAPNVGFAIDVGFATDTPDIEKKTLGSVILGHGPILSRSANDNPVLCKILRETAKKKNIKIQQKAGFRASGGTDTAQIQLTRNGVATSLIGIPNRYMHTPVEICDLRDVEAAIKLLTETIVQLKPGQTFIPGID